MDFGSGWFSRVLKLKTNNRPTGVGLVRSEPTSDRRSCRIGWRRVGCRWVECRRVGWVGQVASFHGHP